MKSNQRGNGTIIGFIFTAVICALLIGMWSRDTAPDKFGVWESPPEVYICSGVDVESVEFAVSFWKEQGYEFSEIFELSQSCPDEMGGGIIVSMALLDEKQLGLTTVTFDAETGIISHVRVRIHSGKRKMGPKSLPRDGTVSEILYTHEFGHALGFKHLNQNRHVMAPIMWRQGLGDEGLQREY